jgi:hypothetical protein
MDATIYDGDANVNDQDLIACSRDGKPALLYSKATDHSILGRNLVGAQLAMQAIRIDI